LDSTLGNWNSRAFVASFLPRARLHMMGLEVVLLEQAE
jgi:hypothetical protein